MDIRKWDRRFLNLAAEVAAWSKDPSTQTGAVIVTNLFQGAPNRIISVGFNGFPQHIHDDERLNERALKYEMVVHAEANAILFAARDLRGCSIYTSPFMPCSRCAGLIIQSGIKRVVALEATPEQLERWGANFELSHQMFAEASVVLEEITLESL